MVTYLTGRGQPETPTGPRGTETEMVDPNRHLPPAITLAEHVAMAHGEREVGRGWRGVEGGEQAELLSVYVSHGPSIA